MTQSLTLSGVSLVGADELPGTGAALTALNPATGHTVGPTYHEVDDATIADAARQAWQAFRTYRHTDFATRAAFLETIADEIDALGEVLIERVNVETGIPSARARGELARTTGQLRLFAAVVRDGSWTRARLDTADPNRAPLPKPDLRQRRIPLGPVAVFAASNFPLAFSVAGGDTASALAAGCPVIVKAHPAHPGTSELVGHAIRNAVVAHGLPDGTFALLFTSIAGGVSLVKDPNVRAVGFTGSRRGGLALVAAAAERPVPIPVFAEMSSVNPVFVLPGALAERAADLAGGLVASLTTGVGQLCTSPGLVFLTEGAGADEFVNTAAESVRAAAASAMLSPGVAAAFDEGAQRISSTRGVDKVAEGVADPAIACSGLPQLYVTTGLEFLDNPKLEDEVFGAVSVIVRVADVDEMVTIAEKLEGQLTATIHLSSSDHAAAARLLGELELTAGRVLVNGWPTGVEVGHAVVHGGPFPATSAPSTTSVGSLAIERFLRPVAYQNVPDELLAAEIRDGNPLGIWRRVDGVLSRD
jgi:NADP-dependent aldehyde dehydrogenase